MPFVSKKQYRWAFASGQPWARRWARETPSLSKLPAEAKASEDMVTAPAAAPAPSSGKPMTPQERARHAALVRWQKAKAAGQQKPGGAGKPKAPAGPTAEEVAARASDRMVARAEREASKQSKEAEREAKKREAEEKKQKKGGGGGGGKKDEEKQKAEAEKQKAEAEKQERDELTLALDLWEKNKRGLSLREQVRAIQLGIAKFDNAGNIVRLKPETKAESYTPPQAVQAAARRALEQRADQPPSNRAGTPVGIARARDLANGRSVSMPIVRRMKAFFDRHRGTKPTTQPVKDSKWQQAWGLWGGDAGYRWAQSIVARETKNLEDVAFDLLDEAIKHGKHNQASHGRRTARRRAYSAAYSQARAGGATPQEAREKAKAAGVERQAERDVRLGRLREAVERRKSTPETIDVMNERHRKEIDGLYDRLLPQQHKLEDDIADLNRRIRAERNIETVQNMKRDLQDLKNQHRSMIDRLNQEESAINTRQQKERDDFLSSSKPAPTSQQMQRAKAETEKRQQAEMQRQQQRETRQQRLQERAARAAQSARSPEQIRSAAAESLRESRTLSADEQRRLFGHNVTGRTKVSYNPESDMFRVRVTTGFGQDFKDQYISSADMARLAREGVTLTGLIIDTGTPDTWIDAARSRRATKSNEPTDPELWAESIREAKKKFRVYPSAYANAWAARRYKMKGGTWRSATKDLREWFAEEWVDISRPKDGGGYEVCGRPTEGMSQEEYRQRYPKCLPKARAMKLTEAQRLRLIRRKRRSGLPERGRPIMTSSETKLLELDLLEIEDV